MADQNLTGVTTRELTTGQDSARASAISKRSQLATTYTDQFRSDRNQLRRGGVTRNATGPSVPAAQGDVTQTQDTSVPPSFQDVIMSGDQMSGDSQNANQVINPGPGGGSSGGGGGSGSSFSSGSLGGGSGSGGSSSSGGQVSGSNSDRYWDNENDPIYESAEYQPGATTPTANGYGVVENVTQGTASTTGTAPETPESDSGLPPGYRLVTKDHAKNANWLHHGVYAPDGRYVAAWNMDKASGNIARTAFGSSSSFHNMIYGG